MIWGAKRVPETKTASFHGGAATRGINLGRPNLTAMRFVAPLQCEPAEV